MDMILLDVVDVVPARTSGGLDLSFYLVVAATILAEAVVMLLMKYNPFGKSALHSFLVNAASVVAGFLLVELFPGLFDPYQLSKLFTLMLLTIVIELPLLYLLNKTKLFPQTLRSAIVMNVISYALFYGYITVFTK